MVPDQSIWIGEENKIQQLLEFSNSLDEGLKSKAKIGGISLCFKFKNYQ